MTLEVKKLTCTRGDRELFCNLSFTLKAKQLMYLEGANGSGKTTLLRTLCGLYLADEGEILWDGITIKKQDEAYRKDLLYLGHQNGIKADLTAYENLRLNCRMAGISASKDQLIEALDTIGLFAFEDFPVRTLSQGQKRRVALAKLLLSNAKLWILDEPFVALDTVAVEQLQSIIGKHVESGGVVILTTHQEVPLTSGELVRVSLNKSRADYV
ncbi:cytochrome c biogenesis heme-transporting ATPase CcmA [Cocleimonas sp. KMM 6892]|uniref:cytochrome c biogenesis heme-transporting ATPase CcmA n=1 Tax=unclassified Cocleimonas TaxID=2639732 RepID=UPI002DBFF4BC|nr:MULTISPECIES: cytochrome c biogenesis heme-transporting ATPase CcmA [unclassified Cocleimonas]MEB8432485.1 cytochrome c biogenesis heme-transporting ATPase CcmA [Cocleimonas sp. KMM 6892]MEC4715344.1 cytochrome c biogenesis heme-transporting ATPase CcmA [Cocleimonas sp. KMM 6895]MEC4745037.1 cytochrome c biogenesis heme-transporting ATPase CcmA [Cocleimonas sp. KMM 6896]